MKLNLYYSHLSDDCTAPILKKIVPNNKDSYVIITPDRRTFLTEQELFAHLSVHALFNVNVTTFSRFATEQIAKSGMENKKVLNKAGAIAIIKKIMLENASLLTAFQKAAKYEGTSATIFETISMFKSCNMTPESIQPQEIKNPTLKSKMADLKLIYTAYENYLQNEYTDSFNKLTLLSKLLDGANFPQTHFIFLGFDDFTPQTYEILKKLILKSQSVTVSCTANLSQQNNKNIFLNNIYYNIKSVAQTLGVAVNEVPCEGAKDDEKSWFASQVFGHTVAKSNQVSTHFQITHFENKEREAEFVAKNILWSVMHKGSHFYNSVVVVPSLLNYKNVLRQTFLKYHIPAFFDENQSFTDHVLVRFFLHLFEAVNSEYDVLSVLTLLKDHVLLNRDAVSEVENAILGLGLTGKKLFTLPGADLFLFTKPVDEVYAFLNGVYAYGENKEKLQTISQHLTQLKEFLTHIDFERWVEFYLAHYEKTNEVSDYKLTTQVYKKLNTAWDELEKLLGDYACSFEHFSLLAGNYLSATGLSIPPLELDTVFVADSVHSYFASTSDLYVLGANADVLPVSLHDLGIIRDDEIALLAVKTPLSPTVEYINKRNRLLLYEKLLKASDKCWICYETVNENNETLLPSAFVEDVKNMFACTGSRLLVNGDILLQKLGYNAVSDENDDNFLFNNPTVRAATENFITMLKDWPFYVSMPPLQSDVFKQQAKLLLGAMDTDTKQTLLNHQQLKNTGLTIQNARTLFFPNNTTSVSQFERFLLCPFEHFVQYGLKLKETLNSEIDARQFGNFLHEFVAELLPQIGQSKNLTDAEIDVLAMKVFEQIKQSSKNKDILRLVNNPKNHFALLSLSYECRRIAAALHFEQCHSRFVPTKLESPFGFNQDGIVIGSSSGNPVTLKGIIDRVDTFENQFRIIDYKSGTTDFSNFTEIAGGKKLQLLVYIKPEQGKRVCAGAFYLKMNNRFVKEKDNILDLYKLKGIITNELSTILAMDDTLQTPSAKGSVLSLKTKEDGTIASNKLVLSAADIAWLADYAVTFIETAFAKMIQGDITPHPLKFNDSQKYEQTDIVGLSHFDVQLGNSFRKVSAVAEFDKNKLLVELNLFASDVGLTYDENLKQKP